MAIVRCNLAFHKTPIGKLGTFAVGVRDGIYKNPSEFAAPIITEITFNAAITAYENMYGAYTQGGNAQKGPFFAAEEALMDLLDEQVVYVDAVAQGDANIIWLSGFKPTKATKSKKPAPKQFKDVKVKRVSTGVMQAKCEHQPGVDVYICIVTAGVPIPDNIQINEGGQLPVGENAPAIPLDPNNPIAVALPFVQANGGIFDFTKGRKKKFLGLTPGVTYYFTFFGINTAGVGQFSAPVGLVCW
ncbi:MAG: hypothetical protein K9J17_18490 [Flavobacteriales bacterium]|nr:hypothetical protein [Flavobacteriales bacterium]